MFPQLEKYYKWNIKVLETAKGEILCLRLEKNEKNKLLVKTTHFNFLDDI